LLPSAAPAAPADLRVLKLLGAPYGGKPDDDEEACDIFKNRPLHWAARNGHWQVKNMSLYIYKDPCC